MLEALLQDNDEVERCGLVLEGGESVELKNIAEEPATGFEMDPEDVLPYLDRTIGTWHTHPVSTPNLSGDDYLFFLGWPDFQHHIIGKNPDGTTRIMSFIVKEGVVEKCD